MKNDIVVSKGGSLFHPMVSVILFLCCVPAFASGNWVVLSILLVLVGVTSFMHKVIKIDLATRKYKYGLFSSWDDLSIGGYISIFNETSGQRVNARSQSTKIVIKELRLNYIQGKKKKHIYTAKTREEAEKIALKLAEAWDAGVYDSKSRTWLKERAE
jgi:hypothetical protein